MNCTMYRTRRLIWIVPLMLSCMAAMASGEEKKYQVTKENYQMPDVTLIDQEGKRVGFKDMMRSDKPIVVDFIFSTCSTICPVLSASFVNLQNRLGAASRDVRLVSISIDPENDTPRMMKEYLKRYRARPGWDFLTGSRKDIDSVMRAFNAYIPNKMSHYPLMLIRVPRDGTWLRIFGILSTSEFMDEVQKAGGR
jgi:protein SCO1/2